MTGFGQAQFKDTQMELNLQIRSVNHRFFEIIFHIPQNLAYLEGRIKNYLHKRLKRGRFTFDLYISGGLVNRVIVNKEMAKQYFNSLRILTKELCLPGEITLAQVSALPGVLTLKESYLPEQVIWPRIGKLLSAACSDLLSMRLKEGKAISQDIIARTNKINNRLLFVRHRVPLFIANKRRQFKNAAGNIDVSASFSRDSESNRRNGDVVAIIKNCDISEEITRLAFHLKNFGRKIKSDRKYNLVGKELDFVAQEMQREVNTMGAKSQDAHLGAAVIEMKSEIEKIREQLQNAE